VGGISALEMRRAAVWVDRQFFLFFFFFFFGWIKLRICEEARGEKKEQTMKAAQAIKTSTNHGNGVWRPSVYLTNYTDMCVRRGREGAIEGYKR